jgi:hypothetical protein
VSSFGGRLRFSDQNACAGRPGSSPARTSRISVGAGYKLFFSGHAVGTQNYLCTVTPSGSTESFFTGPQATVYDADLEQNMTHFLSRNPSPNELHATWQHSRDSSLVWAKRLQGSTDSRYVRSDAIEWLILEVTGFQTGPTGGDRLTRAVRIQRVNTVGGAKPPASTCHAGTLTSRVFVPYEADYFLYALD